MIIRAKIKGHNEWLFWEELPENPKEPFPISEKNISINRYPVNISSYQILSNGIFLIQAEMYFEHKVEIISEVDSEAIVSQFVLTKNVFGKVVFSRHNIRYIPSLFEAQPVPGKQKYTYFLLVMTPLFYRHLVTVYSPLHAQFQQQMALHNRVSLFEKDLTATVEMLETIEALSRIKDKNEVKQIYTNAKVLELIMLQFEQFALVMEKRPDEIRPDDMVKLEEARSILIRQYADPPTQKKLSKMVLLNEFKLRNGFKRYFGTTIYNFITRLRMEEAKRLILEEGKNMYEVGMSVGFKHQASFTHAFRKYYGILPSEVHRN